MVRLTYGGVECVCVYMYYTTTYMCDLETGLLLIERTFYFVDDVCVRAMNASIGSYIRVENVNRNRNLR